MTRGRTHLRPLLLASLLAHLPLLGCGASLVTSGDGPFIGADAAATDLAVAAVDAAADGEADLGMGAVCGNSFCKPGEVCEAGTCRKDCGQAGVRCGEPEACCGMGEVCHVGKCTVPGPACAMPSGDAGVCASTACPDGHYCEQQLGRCLPLAKTNMCEYRPPVGVFSPKVKWEWQGSQVAPTHDQIMMTPMVADLDGDCMPDIVFNTFTGSAYGKDGVLRAVRGDGKGELWSVTDPSLRSIPGSQVALADVDNDGRVEVFACHESGALMALTFEGKKRWISTEKPCRGHDAPFLADLWHDGTPEVVAGFTTLNALTGALIGTPAMDAPTYTTAAELDGDDKNGMELVGGGVVYHAGGKLAWSRAVEQKGNGFAAVGDLDGDGKPDVASVVPGANAVWAWKADGSPLWGPVDVNNGVPTMHGPSGGGPPTIADFDGDGKPEVATAGGYGYLVLRGATGKVLWQNTATRDFSSRVTGSSVFDFEGDGSAEAIYNDELNLRVYRGKDGKVLVKLCSTSGTLYENPVIVDVDADDHAEIVVMANNYAFKACDMDVGGGASHTGFKVIGDAQNRWVRTRRIWNQHTYHVTNIGEDRRVPKDEATNWKQPGLNNFRQNVQTTSVLAAPDLVPRDLRATYERCDKGVIVLHAAVLNQGAAAAPAGVPVTFRHEANVIGTIKTKGPILPGAVESVSIEWTPPPGPSSPQGPYSVTVTVDEPQGVANECDETNNVSGPAFVGCPRIG